MKTITAIEAQRGNQQRVNVHLDGCFAFGLDMAVATKANLSVGQSLTDEELSQFARQDVVQRCHDAAQRFLAYRPRSEAEVRRRLVQHGFPPDAVGEVLLNLHERQLVDDNAFAAFWVENRLSFKPCGERRLRLELQRKGIDAETVHELVDGLDEEETVYNAGKKKARSLADCDERQFRQRLGSFLQRRGFDYDSVAKVVARLWREREGDDEDKE